MDEKGYSHLELILAIALIGILIAAALKMLVRFSVDAEQMDMRQVLESIDQSVISLMGQHLVDDELANLYPMQGHNPMRLLKVAPENYMGERGNADKKPGTGYWYYNYDTRALVYRVKHDSYFNSWGPRDSEAEFKLIFKFTDNNNNNRFDKEVDVAQGLELTPTHRYEWVD